MSLRSLPTQTIPGFCDPETLRLCAIFQPLLLHISRDTAVRSILSHLLPLSLQISSQNPTQSQDSLLSRVNIHFPRSPTSELPEYPTLVTLLLLYPGSPHPSFQPQDHEFSYGNTAPCWNPAGEVEGSLPCGIHNPTPQHITTGSMVAAAHSSPPWCPTCIPTTFPRPGIPLRAWQQGISSVFQEKAAAGTLKTLGSSLWRCLLCCAGITGFPWLIHARQNLRIWDKHSAVPVETPPGQQKRGKGP